MNDSDRTPGYSYRRAGAENMEDRARESRAKLTVEDDDGTPGIAPRTATPQDARRAGRKRSSPLT